MRAETWSALFQLFGVVGALEAFGWAKMPLVAARLRLRTTVDLEIENLSRAIARRVTVEMSSDEPFEESDRVPSNSLWKWGLGDIGPGQQFTCSGTRRSTIRSSGNAESKDAKAIVAAIRDHARAVIDYSD